MSKSECRSKKKVSFCLIINSPLQQPPDSDATVLHHKSAAAAEARAQGGVGGRHRFYQIRCSAFTILQKKWGKAVQADWLRYSPCTRHPYSTMN